MVKEFAGADPSDGSGPDAAPEPDPISEMVRHLRRTIRGVDVYRYVLTARLQMTISEMIALSDLAEFGPMRAGDLAQRIGLTTGSVTTLLDRLEGRGYLRRTRPSSDRRTVLIELTHTGEELIMPIFDALERVVRSAASEVEPAGAKALSRCLGEVADALHTQKLEPPEPRPC